MMLWIQFAACTAVIVFAVGDVLGSCMLNILIIALLDFKRAGPPITARASESQVLSAGYGVLLLALVLIGMFATRKLPALGWGISAWAGIPSRSSSRSYLPTGSYTSCSERGRVVPRPHAC